MKSANPRRALSRPFFAALRVPAIIIGVLLVPFLIYYIHIRAQREYLTSRNFRILATMSDQIKATVDNYQAVIKNACKEVTQAVRPLDLVDFLKPVGLELVEGDCKHGVNVGKLFLSVQREGAQLHAWLHLKDKKSGVEVRINLKDVLGKFMPSEGDTVFEDIVVADQHEGRVLYQQSRSGLRFTEVNVFLKETKPTPESTGEEPDDGKKENKEKSGKRTERRVVHIPSRLIETELAGPLYKVFMQPIQLSLFRLEDESAHDAEWLICGFVRADRFLSETLLISYSVIELLAGLLLLALLSFPFLKLRFMTPRERLTRVDAAFMVVSLVTAASVVTIFALNMFFGWGLEREQDDQLGLVAKKIQDDLYGELVQLQRQLDTFDSEMHVSTLEKTRDGRIRQARPGVTGWVYPSYGIAYWLTDDGEQLVKWTSADSYTPLINVSDQPIYQAFKRGDRWRITMQDQAPPGGVRTVREFLLYSSFSPNSGKNLAAFMRERKSSEYGLRYLGVGAQPLSLFNTALPPGFGFSLVTNDGWAVFHSRDERNQRENLFMECDNNAAIRSAAFGGAGMMTAANYLGREHSLYVTPLTKLGRIQAPLSLVAFRDRVLTRTVSLEILTVALALLAVYLSLLAISLGLAWLCFRPQVKSFAWIWPSTKYAGTYDRLGVTYLSVIVLSAIWLWSGQSYPWALILGVFVLVAAAGVGTVLVVRSGAASDSGNVQTTGYRRAYEQAALGLIIAIGIMPALLFWQAARYFETSLFVSWGQRKLATAVEQRGLNPTEKTGDYGSAFYDTTISPGSESVQSGRVLLRDCLLSNLMIPYNRMASEIRAVAGECQEQPDRAWRWERPVNGPFTLTQPNMAVTTNHLPGLRAPQGVTDWLVLCATSSLLVFLFLLIRSSVSRIFLLDQSPLLNPVGDVTLPDANTKYVLALGPVGSGKSGWLEQQKISQPIRLATMTDVDEAVKLTRLVPRDEPIAIDHFEYRLGDKEFTEQKLELLEQLLFTEKRPVLIVSSADPRYHPDFPSSARWAAVLDQFSERHFSCQAGKHYRSIWTLCTDAEKLMLVQLAQGALVNPKGVAALRQLLWKGLVKREPYRIADAKFQDFVRSVQRPRDVKRWERAEGGGWRTRRGGFLTVLTGIAAILFVAQRDIQQSWIPYITGLAGVLASLSKGVGALRGGGSKSE